MQVFMSSRAYPSQLCCATPCQLVLRSGSPKNHYVNRPDLPCRATDPELVGERQFTYQG
jgi:hypothetical protein